MTEVIIKVGRFLVLKMKSASLARQDWKSIFGL